MAKRDWSGMRGLGMGWEVIEEGRDGEGVEPLLFILVVLVVCLFIVLVWCCSGTDEGEGLVRVWGQPESVMGSAGVGKDVA